MNTKKCKHCQEDIPLKAKRCPKCGGKLGMPTWAKALIIIVVVLGCIVGCMSSCSNAVNEAVDDTKNSYKDVNGKTSFKVNESFENKYEKITMTEVNTNFTDYSEYFGPADGKKIVMLKFEVENINPENDEIYVSSLNFVLSADGVSAEQKYVANDNYNDLSATVASGKKAVGYVFYEVPVTAQKLVVDYNADFWIDGTSIEFVVQE